MNAPRCAPTCPLVARLVTDLARATGRDERVVHLAYGLRQDSDGRPARLHDPEHNDERTP